MRPYIMNSCIICGTCWRACPNFAIAKTVTIGTRLEARAAAEAERETELDTDDV